jgi:hypothetical protein
MAVAKEMVRCPYCREPIAAEASRCKHCHGDLGGANKKKSSLFASLNTFRSGFLCGILFALVLAILAYFQFKGP